jgi:putative DNA primase/helicase
MKLWIATNHKPVIEETADGIWDRVHLVPFRVRFDGDKADEDLGAKLGAEAAGMLAWIVRGCLEWQRDGLNPPPAVLAATERYREESDPLGMFFEDCCVLHPEAEVPATRLYEAYIQWALEVGEEPMKQKAFGAELGDRGFGSARYASGPMKGWRSWHGIGLRDAAHPPDGRRLTLDDPEKSGNRHSPKDEEAGPAAPMTQKDVLVRSATHEKIQVDFSIRIDIRRGAVG